MRRLGPFAWGALAAVVLLALYFGVLTFISGIQFTSAQFKEFWYFIVSLSAGFGIQVGLYVYFRGLIRTSAQTKAVMGISTATSVGAMISCCTHYFVNLLPIIGAAGLVTFAAQYQIQFFWFGILINIGAIIYILRKISEYKEYAEV